MESSTHRAEAERQRQVEIRRKIKALQAQLTELPEDDDNIMQSPKRKQAEATLLAPSTPSPRKKIRMEQSQSLRGRYDVPVEGDWVTIAVVAERGQVRISRAPVNIESGNDGRASGDEGGEDFYTSHSHTKRQKRESEPARPHGKKYVNIKLIDFGARSRSSATGGKATLRGDAFLSLLLFESDTFDNVKKEDGTVCKIYQGGSRGAYEAMSKLKEGDVIALLNPRVLKPYQRSSNNPHPTNNILAVTPESAGSIAIIGRAQDLGMCKAIKRDGKMCGSWTDKRVSEVCEWHLTNAVQKQRSSRAEFLMGTSGMSTSSIRKRKADYDPSRQWGLKPETESNNSTYIISGHVVGGSAGSLFISEKLGREAQAKAQRRMEKNTDRELKALLDRDKEGMKAVTSARAFAAQVAASSEKVDKGKQKAIDISTDSDANRPCAQDSSVAPKQAYSASTIKQLGFDPAGKVGKRVNDLSLQKKIDALTAVQSSRKNIDLGPRPGPKIRSGVSVPTFMLEKSETVDDWDHVPSGDEAHSDDALIYLDSDT
ncbi:hypothetical protein ID866_4545 [Astraeus odoratus]|nr:hypothetical protein ID866_4545 [Astraeus odoratus]